MTLRRARFVTVFRSTGRLLAIFLLFLGLQIPLGWSEKAAAKSKGNTSIEDPVFGTDLSEKLQIALEEVARLQGAESLSASLYISDQCNWHGATGMIVGGPVENNVNVNTLYRFASITKTFTATIILQLVEENKLLLNDPISKWLNEYENIHPKVTVGQLLNHSSGLGGYIGRRKFWREIKKNHDREWKPDEVLGYVTEPYARPGEGIQYSNTNYTLLGLIIEAVTGNPVEQELSERILEPLNFDETTISVDGIDSQHWAINTPPSRSLSSAIWTAGALISTPTEIAKWSVALFSGKFLTQDTLQSVLAFEQRNIGGIQIPMGLGVWDLSSDGVKAWGHGGRLKPFLARMAYLPELDLGVAYAFTGGRGQGLPGKHLVRTYMANKPGDISRCFERKTSDTSN